MKRVVLTISFCCLLYGAHAQKSALNIPGIWQLVDESKSENKLQKTARDRQATNSATEYGNLTMLDKLKKTYRSIQQRYNLLGTAINAADIGLNAQPMVSRIISNQNELYTLARDNPAIIAFSLRAEIEFADKAQLLLRYLTGLCLSLGDVNQMKASDRKVLFDYVLSELSHIQDLSGNLVSSVRNGSLASLVRSLNPFQDYIDLDKDIVRDIITNAKYLK